MDTDVFVLNTKLSVTDLHGHLSTTLCQIETMTKLGINELFLEHCDCHKGNYFETIHFLILTAKQLYQFLINEKHNNSQNTYIIAEEATPQQVLNELTKVLFSINSLVLLGNRNFFTTNAKQQEKINYLKVLERLSTQALAYFERIVLLKPNFADKVMRHVSSANEETVSTK